MAARIEWDTRLPLPRVEGFQRQIGQRFLVFKGDRPGAEKRRQISRRVPQEQSFSMRLTKGLYQILVDFHDDICAGGTSRFLIPDHVLGGFVEASFAEGGQPDLAGNGRVPKLDVSVRLILWRRVENA